MANWKREDFEGETKQSPQYTQVVHLHNDIVSTKRKRNRISNIPKRDFGTATISGEFRMLEQGTIALVSELSISEAEILHAPLSTTVVERDSDEDANMQTVRYTNPAYARTGSHPLWSGEHDFVSVVSRGIWSVVSM